MSYDIEMEISTGHNMVAVTDCLSPTYNIAKIFYSAFSNEEGIRSINGLTGAQALPKLQKAYAFLVDPDNYQLLKEMEPSNGWGSLETAKDTIRTMIEESSTHFKATWGIG